MTDSEAVQIAEGLIEPKGDKAEQETHIVEAWQHLIDTGLAWKLQGWFGRRAAALIKSGHCTNPAT
jgi:hypothetical protein